MTNPMNLNNNSYSSQKDHKWLTGEKGYLGKILPIINNPKMKIEEILDLSNTYYTKTTYIIAALKKGIEKGLITMTVKKGNKNLFKGNYFTRIDILYSYSAKRIQIWWRRNSLE